MNNHADIVSDCQYAFTSFNYEQAKISTKTSPCTNIPVPCPFCLSLGCDQFIWKYNAVVHMPTQHPEDIIPVDLLSKMHISLKETDFMKADLEGMECYRETHDIMNSDDLVEVTVGDKRARASSASSTLAVPGRTVDISSSTVPVLLFSCSGYSSVICSRLLFIWSVLLNMGGMWGHVPKWGSGGVHRGFEGCVSLGFHAANHRHTWKTFYCARGDTLPLKSLETRGRARLLVMTEY